MKETGKKEKVLHFDEDHLADRIKKYIKHRNPDAEFVKDPKRTALMVALSSWYRRDSGFKLTLAKAGMTMPDTGYSLHKSFLITGESQRGKTSILLAFSFLVSAVNPDLKKKMRWRFNDQVRVDFHASGLTALPKYIQPQWLFLDDIGHENEKLMHMGTAIDPIKEIILARDNYKSATRRIFITTNLHGKDLEARYGVRAYNRMKAECNIVIL